MRPWTRFKKWNPKKIAGAALVLALIFFVQSLFGNPLARLQTPLAAFGTWLGRLSDTYVRSETSVVHENETLKRQLQQYAIDAVELETLRQENAQLEHQLAFFERQAYRHLGAHVISRSTGPLTSTFIIDRGRRDGLEIGMPVVVEDGVLIGKILSVRGSSAVVSSVTDPASRVAASVLNVSRTVGTIEGAVGSILNLTFVPQDETLRVDDLIVTSGLEPLVPAGLVIGLINSVESDPTEPFQSAAVQPFVSYRHYASVSVILVDLL